MIKTSPCFDCPLRLFNDNGYKLEGIGNIWSGNALILPNVDYEAYKKQDMSFSSQVEIVQSILSTGGVEQNLCIIPLIRCSENFNIEITQRIIFNCYTYLDEDISNHQIKNIMLCGDAARRILGIDNIKSYLDTVICENKTKRRYFINYSPLVKYINDDLYETFKSRLVKYYNSIVSKIYEYDIKII